ncbi:unnamed protein product [Cuscuta campestris]|uniref:Uncharacterized protein n=1 Tax=Cuscuta campestris TaxID=132261 RepID=A0A484LSH2_9ASTE|nr:unnamed protein product [Cuscuta campestris]
MTPLDLSAKNRMPQGRPEFSKSGQTLDPITFSKIKHLKTAMEIWQGLGKLCEGSEDLRKQKIEVLLEKFKGFKMLPGESFDMLDERFHKILNDLASLNHVLSPKEKNVRLLRSLPTEWYTKATAMEEGRNMENYTVQGLLDELRTYEHELKKKKEEQITPFPTALMTTSRIPSTCPYPKVEKYGERERIEKKKKAMVAAESDESSSSSSDEEALVCMERRVEKSNHEDRWTMSEDDTLCLMAKDDADQEVTSQTSCSSSYSTPTSENLFDQFKKMMKDFEEINLKHTSLTEENKLLSEENLKLTESRKSQLNEITQLKTENESLSEKVKSLNKELGILKSQEAVNKLLETTKHKGRKGLGDRPSAPLRRQNRRMESSPCLLPLPSPIKDYHNSLHSSPFLTKFHSILLLGVRRTWWCCRIGVRSPELRAIVAGSFARKSSKPSFTFEHDHEVLDLSDKDEEVNEGDRMKPTEFIPFRSLPVKTSQRNPDLDSAEPSGNFGQPSNIPDLSNGDNSGNGDPVPIHPEKPTTSVL